MRARWPLFALLAVACTAPLASDEASEQGQGGSARPNVVLVLFEDMSARVGAYGDALARTPAFDRIAAEGVRYTNTYTAAGVCAPSRAALITGRHPQTISAQHMRTMGVAGLKGGGPQEYLAVPPPEVRAFPELLRAAGYYATNDYKTDYQFGEPFTVWDRNAKGADWTGRAEGQPFFAMVTLMTSHESYVWPEDMRSENPLVQAVTARNRSELADKAHVTDPQDVTVPPYLADTPEVRRDIATHYDNVAFTDAALGRIYDRLAADGLLDETIMIVSTDHGDGLPRMKRSLYDSGLRVPFVVRYPDGRGAGTVDNELVSFVDLAPTILDWGGIDAPSWMQGRDFAPPTDDAPRDYVFASLDRMDTVQNLRRAVRDDRYKLIWNGLKDRAYFTPLPFRDIQPSMQALWAGHEAGTLPPAAAALFEPLPTWQLYDTDADPDEAVNLAGDPDYAAVEARLRRALADWRARIGDEPVPETEMIEAMWPGGRQPRTAAPAVERTGSALKMSSATPGAAIGYRTVPDGTWRLYTGPIEAPDETVEAKAIRYGYAESAVVAAPSD